MRRTAAAVTLGDGAPPAGGPPPGDLAALGALLDLLRERDGLDLSGYRRSSLARRVQNRVIAAGEPSLAAYLERLRADPGETARLLDRITIKVSRFFRNRDAVEEVSRAPPRGGPFDLVVCRNTLIYFDVPLQRRALTLLCGALAPGGLLWLGEAEWPPMPLAARLHPIDRRARLLRIAPEGGGHDA